MIVILNLFAKSIGCAREAVITNADGEVLALKA
jgi:hypothetical protein